MEHADNRAVLCGTVAEPPVFSHENHGRRFFAFTLDVPRLSGASDLLPVLAAEDVLAAAALHGGETVRVTGQVRSFNNRRPTGRKLVISVYAESVEPCADPPENSIALTGAICRPPVYRTTPLGREICDVMLAVRRRCRRTDHIPCILWGRTAQETAELPVGTVLELYGRLQSRRYVKVLDDRREERTAYEMSVMEAYRAEF
ncbi:MAG: single-stranded DNA-binding protein [Oscillospiraceae bacterium]|nr:single-stranded DNA-binding protein [Oscillospiraceae bacterium]